MASTPPNPLAAIAHSVISTFSGPLVWAVSGIMILIGIVIAVVIWKMGGQRTRHYALVIDPNRRRVYLEALDELTPGVYRARSTGDIVFIPVTAPAYYMPIGKGLYVYPTIRLGRRIEFFDPPIDYTMSLVLGDEEEEVRDVVDAIMRLYTAGKLPKRLILNPTTSIQLYIDGKRLAEAKLRDTQRGIEDSVIAMADLTGSREEFQKFVETVIRLERAKALTEEKRLFMIAVIATVLGFVAMMILAVVR